MYGNHPRQLDDVKGITALSPSMWDYWWQPVIPALLSSLRDVEAEPSVSVSGRGRGDLGEFPSTYI